jgi:hypothetical protein
MKLRNVATLAKVSALALVLAAFSGFTFAPAAHADAIYNFTYDGCSGGCGPQDPFGTVTLHQVDLETVQISVSLLNNNHFVTTGSHTGFAFNILGGAVTVGTLPDGWVNKGANSEPGFGDFTGGINCAHGNQNGKSGCAGSNQWVGDLIFDVSRAGGLSLDDFGVNGSGFLFATDILSGTTGNTGLVAADGGNNGVPEPGTLAMLGSGLLGLGVMVRRKLSI